MKTLKTLLAMRLALAGMVALVSYTTSAQTWETVDDFQYVPADSYAWAMAGAVDALGRVYICGQASDNTGPGQRYTHGLVRQSGDQGATWTTLEDYMDQGTPVFTFLQAIGFDANQNLYAAGHAQYIGTSSTNMYSSFFVRKSTDYGSTWQTVLDLAFPEYNSFYMGPGTIGFAADSAGAVYIFADLASSGTLLFKSSDAGKTWTTLHPFSDASFARGMVWTPGGLFVIGGSVVRKSTNGGTSWQTVDSGFSQTAICADALGNIYTGGGANVTTGTGRKAVTTYEWVIRKGTNGGTKWTTIAGLAFSGYSSGAYLTALQFNAAGNLYAAGALTASNGSGSHGIVVESQNQGVNWSVVDDFQYTGPKNTYYWFLTSDPDGAVYTGGTAIGGGAYQWIVRRQLGP